MFRLLRIVLSTGLLAVAGVAKPRAPQATRPTPPARDAHTAGYVSARELPDGSNPPANVDGNFIVGPTHNPAPELSVHDGVPRGTLYELVIYSKDSKVYPGIARDAGTFGTPDPTDPGKLVVATSHPAPYTRRVTVYVPKQYVPGRLRRSLSAPMDPTQGCSRR